MTLTEIVQHIYSKHSLIGNQIKNRPKPKIEPIVDGYSGFLF